MVDIKKSAKNLGNKAEELGDKAKEKSEHIKSGGKSKRK